MEYCTYITIYRGNKMPMFYIGRSTPEKIKNGYRGSVSSKKYKKIWTEELENNPELFLTKILTFHNTKKAAAEKEEYFHRKFSVHKNPMYINQATGQGGFYVDSRGNKNPWFGKPRDGKLNPMFGRKHKESSRQKMSENQRGKHSQPKTESFKKRISELQKGKTFEERFGAERSAEIKAKQRKPKTEEHKEKLRQIALERGKLKITCPHCSRDIVPHNFAKWHGDNCKLFQKFTDPI